MPNCDNCSSKNDEHHLCGKCYNNIFKSLYCDGHCGRKCDPSQRTGSNIIAKFAERKEKILISLQIEKDLLNLMILIK